MRKFVLIGVALVAALGTAFLITNWLKTQQRPVVVEQKVIEKKDPGLQVLVADRDLPAGTILLKDHLRWQQWPEDGVIDVYVVKKKDTDAANDPQQSYLGAVVRRGIAKGEPITAKRVVRQGERGFLAAILTPGMRAVAVPVNAASGVAGLLFPGDRVDVILTHQVSSTEGGKKKNRRASETVLRNVRLLAVDQRTNDQNNTPAVAKTATLEVTPKQAEALTILTDMGRLSLSLVSLARKDMPGEGEDALAADDPIVPTLDRTSYTVDSQISPLLSSPGRKKKTRRLRVVRGNQVQSFTFGVNNETLAEDPVPAPVRLVPTPVVPAATQQPAQPEGAGAQPAEAQEQDTYDPADAAFDRYERYDGAALVGPETGD